MIRIQKKWLRTIGYKYASRNKSLKVTSSGFLSDREVANDLDECFGKGKKRQLRPGENSLCEEQMNSFINDASFDKEILNASSAAISLRAVREAKLNHLADYPLVMK